MKQEAASTNVRCAHQYCSLPEVADIQLDPRISPDRRRLIRMSNKKWANGTELRYCFLTGRGQAGTEAERKVVTAAFERWKNVGIGLKFLPVESPDEAEIRIAFRRGDGAWSYVGRDILEQAQSEPTMNFGWNIKDDIDTAIHEIGHTLGFSHEHQNPNAGISWNQEAVYKSLSAAPNFWDRDTTYWNILRKLPDGETTGSAWDKDSIMHYPFSAGLIALPERYRTEDLVPRPGLSAADKRVIQRFYPRLRKTKLRELKPFRSVKATLDPGEQLDFVIRPKATRWYQLQTFGHSDSVIVLFERVAGKLRYRDGADDSGADDNARIEAKLFACREYVVRVRLYWQHCAGEFGVMLW